MSYVKEQIYQILSEEETQIFSFRYVVVVSVCLNWSCEELRVGRQVNSHSTSWWKSVLCDWWEEWGRVCLDQCSGTEDSWECEMKVMEMRKWFRFLAWANRWTNLLFTLTSSEEWGSRFEGKSNEFNSWHTVLELLRGQSGGRI